MLKNYFRIAYRNLIRNANYTVINVAGLAVGIAVCMMIFLVIRFQNSFDDFHPNGQRIYRILTSPEELSPGAAGSRKNVPFPMASGLKTTFPQLEAVTQVYASHNDVLQVLNSDGFPVKNFKEQDGVFYTDPSFFRMFHFPLLAGSYASLKDPNNVLLTKETAERYFGDWRSAMGKTIRQTATYRIGSGLFQSPPLPLKVSGVLATIPGNTDFQMKMVVSFGTDFTGDKVYGFQIPDWKLSSPDLSCFVILPPNVSAGSFDTRLNDYASKAQGPEIRDAYRLQPISAIHYDTVAGNFSNRTISRELLNVLWLIAAFILLIACVNFVNLSTAQGVNRAREVGVRKVLGGNRLQLQTQFMVEAFLIVASAMVLAAIITVVALPYVQQLLELPVSFELLRDPWMILFIMILIVVVTALAGFYPSMVLARFKPVIALKTKLTANTVKGVSLRRGLVVFQFVIAQVLIIGTIVVVLQTDHFMHEPLGFDKDAVVNVPFRPDSTGGRLNDYLRQQLMGVKGVQGVSFHSNTPVDEGDEMWTSFKFNRLSKEADFQAILKFADQEYMGTYKLPLVAGRNLQASDMTREFLVNESFVKSLGLARPEDILNKELSIWDDLVKCTVVGVLKDFNNRPFRHAVAPLMISTNATMYRQVSIKLATTNMAATMGSVQEIWEKTFPELVYEYRFLDDKIAGFYKQENQLAELYKIFAAIAVFLSCLGLYGLASFMAVQRTKEVGIRKVLGASAGSIVYLFSREFVILIAIAFAIAAPIAWYYMHQWLQDFAYRINVSWWLFAAGGLAAVIIALATISFQAFKAAVANPIKSLRME